MFGIRPCGHSICCLRGWAWHGIKQAQPLASCTSLSWLFNLLKVSLLIPEVGIIIAPTSDSYWEGR